jgi:hypothetical protein
MTTNTTKDTEDKRDRNLLKATCECGHGIRTSRRVLEVAKPKCSVCHKKFVAVIASAVVVLATALVATASSAGASSVRPMTAQRVAAKLAPLGCVAKRVPTADINEMGGITPKVELSCTVNGESVNIDQYRSAQQVAYNNHMLKGMGCVILKGFGITDARLVTDGVTTTSAQTAATTARIRHSLGHGATVTAVHCK